MTTTSDQFAEIAAAWDGLPDDVRSAILTLARFVATKQVEVTTIQQLAEPDEITGRKLKRPSPAADFLTPSEAAAMIGVTTATLSGWRFEQREGKPPFSKYGNRVWYRKSALEAWMKRQSKEY